MKIKICGLFRDEDIAYVNEAEPDFIGFVFAKSKRQVTPVQAKQLKSELKSSILSSGVFVDAQVEDIVQLVQDDVIEIIQLHGNEDSKYIEKLRAALEDTESRWRNKPSDSDDTSLAQNGNHISTSALDCIVDAQFSDIQTDEIASILAYEYKPPVQIIKAVSVQTTDDIVHALLTYDVDGLLLDHGRGGTGKAFDWSILKALTSGNELADSNDLQSCQIDRDGHIAWMLDSELEFIPRVKRIWLAGGINVANIDKILEDEALNHLVYCIDVSSGAETFGIKDKAKINTLVHKAHLQQ
ncbi:MAG: phosphoribosylanthranilate isomerase [Clostridiales Family XIII bacterium]|nr:phosphoribosylanthranilate isomerase [Clostridiales Family XIII bacterium]